jgi:hypothetical protein
MSGILNVSSSVRLSDTLAASFASKKASGCPHISCTEALQLIPSSTLEGQTEVKLVSYDKARRATKLRTAETMNNSFVPEALELGSI